MRPLEGALIVGAAVLLAVPALAADGPFWHAHAAQEASLVLDQGRKWQTDAPLREGMAKIRAALEKGAEHGALAGAVKGEVGLIVQNCRLEPAADAQLHLVLIQVMAGAEAMEGKVEGESRHAGGQRIARALNAYGKHFYHPGWRDL